MKSFWIGLILLVALSSGVGCSRLHLPFRKSTPHQAQAPAIKPKPVAPAPVVAPAPPAPSPVPPAPLPTPETNPAPPKPKKTHVLRHHAKPTKKIVTDSATPANGTSEATSPIGLLSAGDSSENPALRQQTMVLIASAERRLKTVNANIAASKRTTLAQIHLFLTQARQALVINDLQGANTLATKAKILVDELLR